jgi:hypothetical protein
MRDSRQSVLEGVSCRILRWNVWIIWGLSRVSERQIGLVDYFDRLDDQVHAQVSLGQAVLAMVREWPGLEPPSSLPGAPVL